jgi:hypothetical protein
MARQCDISATAALHHCAERGAAMQTNIAPATIPPHSAPILRGEGQAMNHPPIFPTDYYNAGGSFTSARYLDHNGECWYGVSFNAFTCGSMPQAYAAAKDDLDELKHKGREAKIIHERTKDQEQYRLWFVLR